MKRNKWTEYKIGVIALIAWLVIWLISDLTGGKGFPFAYFQKIAFGIIGMSIIMAVAWWRMGQTTPVQKAFIDPDNEEEFNKLSQWEKYKSSFWYLALYAVGSFVLASLC